MSRHSVWKTHYIPDGSLEAIELTTQRLLELVSELHVIDQDDLAHRAAAEGRKRKKPQASDDAEQKESRKKAESKGKGDDQKKKQKKSKE